MSEEQGQGHRISANVSGPVQGQVAVGTNIEQQQSVRDMRIEVTEAERAELRAAFAGVREEVASKVAPEKRGAAVERLDELEEAVTAEEPDVSTIQYVKRWFVKNLPEVAGSVVSLVVHPIVGKLVEAAGEAVAGQFKEVVGAD